MKFKNTFENAFFVKTIKLDMKGWKENTLSLLG